MELSFFSAGDEGNLVLFRKYNFILPIYLHSRWYIQKYDILILILSPF